jgi:hypothetical protein
VGRKIRRGAINKKKESKELEKQNQRSIDNKKKLKRKRKNLTKKSLD